MLVDYRADHHSGLTPVREVVEPLGVWEWVVGQEQAVGHLRAAVAAPVHAYLLVGLAGSGTRAAARALAAGLICPQGGCGECRHCRLVKAESHPDVSFIDPLGAALGMEEVREATRLAFQSPQEAKRRVIVVSDLHASPAVIPALLKTVEEPPESTVMILVSERLGADTATLASRCSTIHLGRLGMDVIVKALVDRGCPLEHARNAAAQAAGDLDKAYLLAADDGLGRRQGAWRSIPSRLDGTGATVAGVVGELLALGEAALGPLRERQAAEIAEVKAAPALPRGVGISRKDLEERHKRQQRKVRVEVLRAGLGALAAAYRDRLDQDPMVTPAAQSSIEAIRLVDEASSLMVRNPNEALLLQALLVRLTRLQGAHG